MSHNHNNLNKTAHIVFIADENYLVPTSVAIQSLIDSREYGKYEIIVVTSGISEETYKKYMLFQNPDISIRIVEDDAETRFRGYHIFDEDAICAASIAALLKFALPELLPDLDRVLYLDGDLIVKEDLHKLYETELNGNYLAAVKDSGGIYFHSNTFVGMVDHYFNSGVMLLDLQKMRELDLSVKLMETKRNLNDSSLMDQNVFNLVMDGHVQLLPIRYNFLPVNLYRAYDKWTVEDINEYFSTDYTTKKEILADCAIIHYSSKDKPWKAPDGACASEWIHEYLRTPLESHDLVELEKSSDEVDISVIMPCYNTAKYLPGTLQSMLEQTFSGTYEIICIDDGSTDDTLNVLKEYEAKNQHIRVISDTNHGQGYQRNFGISIAKGKYIYYMDSDDQLAEGTFQKLYDVCEENHLDLVYFEATSIFENEQLEIDFGQYNTVYCRKEWNPIVYSGEELYTRLRSIGGYISSPCLQLVRKDLITSNHISFPKLPMMEDEQYVYHVMRAAGRVKVLTDSLYLRLVRENSTMTRPNRSADRTISLLSIIRDVFRDVRISDASDLCEMTMRHLIQYKRLLVNNLEENSDCKELLDDNDWRMIREIEIYEAINRTRGFGSVANASQISFRLPSYEENRIVELRRLGGEGNYSIGFCVTEGEERRFYRMIDGDGNWLMDQASVLSIPLKNPSLKKVELRKCGSGENYSIALVTYRGTKKKFEVLIKPDGTRNWVTPSELEARDKKIAELEKKIQQLTKAQMSQSSDGFVRKVLRKVKRVARLILHKGA